ncbi:hypothetical protein PtA15_3A900 [Puccinia triticina]|uniref:Uncharacterized protein n=1 Tax=Puccinia triticina TaxID=208348 RepID=A0ABY7CFR4_9BASI|nr:uncharacterized protein PtA15_3A900 [Puccinia triticina]WAQ83529.1 hypothetical protein PtA15_3A900 [Puccinia triticina]WAR54358.1 hypothetical protein PtB15_3B872 [Puccinia triticina]
MTTFSPDDADWRRKLQRHLPAQKKHPLKASKIHATTVSPIAFPNWALIDSSDDFIAFILALIIAKNIKSKIVTNSVTEAAIDAKHDVQQVFENSSMWDTSPDINDRHAKMIFQYQPTQTTFPTLCALSDILGAVPPLFHPIHIPLQFPDTVSNMPKTLPMPWKEPCVGQLKSKNPTKSQPSQLHPSRQVQEDLP